jgi:hypothetical protein
MRVALNRFRELSLVLLVSGSAMALPYTGDVSADFGMVPFVVEVTDAAGDVGLPLNAPMGTVSGWDVERVLFHLDEAADQLDVGIEYFGIAGDVDGDGFDGVSSPWLAANGGIDLPNLEMTESICIVFDFDQDGTYDVIAGVGANGSLHRVTSFVGSPLVPAFGFNGDLPAHLGPYFYAPPAQDYELSLSNFSVLDQFVNGVLCFDFLVFSGSYQDDGVGEDLVHGTVCFERDIVSAIELPSSFGLTNAAPNPFNPTTTLSYTVAETGPVSLAVYNLQGQLVRTLVDGVRSSGEHQVVFEAAGLPSGMYLAQLRTEQGADVVRLVLAK